MKLKKILFIPIFLFSACNALPSLNDVVWAVKSECANVGSLLGLNYQFSLFGDEDISKSLKAETREILKNLEIPNYENIALKKLNKTALQHLPFFSTHNAIFFNEGWLNQLPSDERKWLIAHEASHIRGYDILKQKGAHLGLMLFIIPLADRVPNEGLSILAVFLLMKLSLSRYQRHLEFQADTNAAKLVGKEGGIKLMSRFLPQPLPQGQKQSLKEKLSQWLNSWIDTHPTDEERIKNLENIS